MRKNVRKGVFYMNKIKLKVLLVHCFCQFKG
nr:MAG TPA: hypothetical protein [Caudoviricetes sp.]